MDFLASVITYINVLTNAFGRFVLAPIALLPGWLSNTIISAVIGVVLLIIFKYTSNQKAVGSVRDTIKANLLALKLFKDSVTVTLQSQGRIFKGAFLLLFHSIRPMLVMIIPVCLLIVQMSLWYQYRPLRIGEETLITVQLNDKIDNTGPDVSITTNPAFEITAGPVHIFSKHQVCWEIKALEDGRHKLTFQVDNRQFEKDLTVGRGFMRLSPKRPSSSWSQVLSYPAEKPFNSDSIVSSISIDYPDRLSRTSGTNWWLIYFFVISMVFAFTAKPFLKVRI